MRTPLDDTLQRVLDDAQRVVWSTWRGAYGASDASDHYRDVPRMLRTLVELDDTEAAPWGDAYDDFLLSHVWHQHTIYPVTPLVSGFLIRIASLRALVACDPAEQIARGLRVIAETAAAFRQCSEPEKSRLGELTAATFVAHRHFIGTWRSGPLEADASAIQSWLPEVGTYLGGEAPAS